MTDIIAENCSACKYWVQGPEVKPGEGKCFGLPPVPIVLRHLPNLAAEMVNPVTSEGDFCSLFQRKILT